ncbi:MAG: hypothetical protein LAO78_04725 [Acidobacteriia bacterium]|nr:hypothetical protein [Terriglobia bacterium]
MRDEEQAAKFFESHDLEGLGFEASAGRYESRGGTTIHMSETQNLNPRRVGHDIVALARKLVKIVYDTLKNQWVFEDFPSFTLAA